MSAGCVCFDVCVVVCAVICAWVCMGVWVSVWLCVCAYVCFGVFAFARAHLSMQGLRAQRSQQRACVMIVSVSCVDGVGLDIVVVDH